LTYLKYTYVYLLTSGVFQVSCVLKENISIRMNGTRVPFFVMSWVCWSVFDRSDRVVSPTREKFYHLFARDMVHRQNTNTLLTRNLTSLQYHVSCVLKQRDRTRTSQSSIEHAKNTD